MSLADFYVKEADITANAKETIRRALTKVEADEVLTRILSMRLEAASRQIQMEVFARSAVCFSAPMKAYYEVEGVRLQQNEKGERREMGRRGEIIRNTRYRHKRRA